MTEKGAIIIKKLFDLQDELKTFPLPTLESTAHHLIEWIKPLVNEKKFEETKRVADDFFTVGGEGEKLQQKLEQLKEEAEYNWLTPFWEDHYLKYRGSLPTGMHFNILVDRPHLPIVPTTAELAGRASYLVAEYYHKIIDEEIEPMFLKGTPLDMGQFNHFFRSVRVPQLYRDSFVVGEFSKEENFIVFIYKNEMYQVPVTNERGEIYSSRYIAEAIDAVMDDQRKDGVNIGLFTTAERDEAAHIYNELKLNPENEQNLALLADALIVISVDEDSETSEDALENLMLHAKSKYYDKTIQLSITKRGRFGYSIEHTAVDGTTIFSVISHINDGFKEGYVERAYTDEKPVAKPLTWHLTPEVEERLQLLEEVNIERRETYLIESSKVQSFGADAIKQLRLSPDAFFHIALQLAQYRTFGTLKSVYEPVSIRHYREGRTECARATSMEKFAVVQAVENGASDADIYQAMQIASEAHAKRIMGCRNGFGIERHLFGLEQVWLQYGEELEIDELPALFEDEGVVTLRTDTISTSGMAYDNVHSRIFGPVAEDGFGIAYIILADSISINLSAYRVQEETAHALMNHLIDALKTLKELAENVVQERVIEEN